MYTIIGYLTSIIADLSCIYIKTKRLSMNLTGFEFGALAYNSSRHHA